MNMKGSKGGPPRVAAGLLALVVLAGCGRGGPATGALRPSLAIASYFPLTIQGRHFRPAERVVLRAQPRQAGLKPVYARSHAQPDGVFIVRLRGYGLDPCTGFTVTATGSMGSRAVVSSSPHGCPPVPAPSGTTDRP